MDLSVVRHIGLEHRHHPFRGDAFFLEQRVALVAMLLEETMHVGHVEVVHAAIDGL